MERSNWNLRANPARSSSAVLDDLAGRAGRSPLAQNWLVLFVAFAVAVFGIHALYLQLPYFWDELGQFVPAALDLYHDGALVPHSAVPNAHPPGVMAYLAAVWSVLGYSIAATRAAMLLLASAAVLLTFLLAKELTHEDAGAPAWIAALLLVLDPLFYMQAMMAQLDMPAMLFTLLTLLLFLQDRHKAAAIAATALVLVKETGALLPALLAIVCFFDRDRRRSAAYYAAPLIVLSGWLFLLWRSTGHVFGDSGFTHYNLEYSSNPVRAALSFVRRVYYLFIANFRWVATLAILVSKRAGIFSNRAWKLAWTFLAAHVVAVSVLGGAELERYLLPVLPIIYIAAAEAWPLVRTAWRAAGLAALAAGLLLGWFVNPIFPFPFENNLAMTDFVQLHRDAARFLERTYPDRAVHTAWPLTAALRNPAFGYVGRSLSAVETSDLHRSTLEALDPKAVAVLVLYSRTWEPAWSVLRIPAVAHILSRYYEYEPQMAADEVRAHFGLEPVRRWTRRGQWIEIYARPGSRAAQ